MSATAINSHLSLTGSWEIQWQLYQIHYLDAMLLNHSVSIKIRNHFDLIVQKTERSRKLHWYVIHSRINQSGGPEAEEVPLGLFVLYVYTTILQLNSKIATQAHCQPISS